MLRALLARRQESRTQSTSAINYASVGDTFVCISPSHRNLTNYSILPLKLLWYGQVTSGDVIEASREFVRISNIKIILFVKLFLASQMQASGCPSGVLEVDLEPLGPS